METYTASVKALLLNRVLLVLSFVGLFIAGVLSIDKISGSIPPCGISNGCEKVANDPSSMIGPIAVAYIGFVGYAALAALAIARSVMGLQNSRQLVTIGYVGAGLGTVYSLYLQYHSLFVIHAICPWCLSSAITMILTLVVYAFLSQEMGSLPVAPPTEEAQTGAQPWDMRLMVALPIVCLLAMGMVSAQGTDSTTLPQDREKLLVPADSPVFGDSASPITIVEFADLSCPSCQDAFPKLKEFAQSYPGKVKLVFRHFPLKKHEYATVSAAMAVYAQGKGKFWDFTSAVMGLNREPNSIDELFSIAQQMGLDIVDLKKHLSDDNDPIFKVVARDLNDGAQAGVHVTPTTFVMVKGMPTKYETGHNAITLIEAPPYDRILHGS